MPRGTPPALSSATRPLTTPCQQCHAHLTEQTSVPAAKGRAPTPNPTSWGRGKLPGTDCLVPVPGCGGGGVSNSFVVSLLGIFFRVPCLRFPVVVWKFFFSGDGTLWGFPTPGIRCPYFGSAVEGPPNLFGQVGVV